MNPDEAQNHLSIPKFSIPVNALRDLLAGLHEAAKNMSASDEAVIEAESLIDALRKVAACHPELIVALYLRSELQSLEK
jgi:predicted transcriptional regulator